MYCGPKGLQPHCAHLHVAEVIKAITAVMMAIANPGDRYIPPFVVIAVMCVCISV